MTQTQTQNAAPTAGRPKTLGKTTHFNTKLQEETKRDLEAILEMTDFVSYRDMIESFTRDYLAANPTVAHKVKAYRKMVGN